MKILLSNISKLHLADNQKGKHAGAELTKLNSIQNAYVLLENGLIHSFGKMEMLGESRYDKVYDVRGNMVLPAWCDSHTHLVYAESREAEFIARVKGVSYEEIARGGGGILNSAKKLQESEEEALFDDAMLRIEEIRNLGTGAVEIKSGYGLTKDAELKMLRVIRKIKENSDLEIKATFLGAHAYPSEYKNDHQAYINLLIQEMLPEIAAEGLADFIDVFCDRGFFSVEETDQILQAGAKYGLKPKIHANELDYSGGIQVGVKNHAISVDHLECTGDDEVKALLNSETMPTLLPSTAFFLGLEYSPARMMIDSGLPVALASDYNPGSSPSGNMFFVIALACIKMKMLPEEALQAATLNGAYAMNIEDVLGSIKVGKKANLIVTKDIDNIARIPYSFGSNLIEKVIINGKI